MVSLLRRPERQRPRPTLRKRLAGFSEEKRDPKRKFTEEKFLVDLMLISV